MTGAGVVRACAEAAGRHDVIEDCDRRSRFHYIAPESLAKAIKRQLGGTASVQTYSSGSASPGPAASGRAAARTSAGAAPAAFQEPTTPPARTGGAGASAAPAAGSGIVRGARQRLAAVRVPAIGRPAGPGGGLAELQGEPELLYLLQTQVGGLQCVM